MKKRIKKIKKKSVGVKPIPKKIDENHFRVAIFGSARVHKNDKNYKLIYHLAKMISEENLDIVTGGGPGTMEAANSGHKAGNKENKSHSFGLLIDLPKEQKANKHLDVKKEFSIFSDRLNQFMYLSNAIVVAPGGIGTLLELFYSWQLIQVEHVCNMPIILLGDGYDELIKWIKNHLLKNKYIEKKDLDFIFVVNNKKEAMDIIKLTYHEYLKSGERGNVCINLKKYRERWKV